MLMSLLAKILKFLYKVDVHVDAEAKNVQGVIICNHLSFLDGILLGVFLPQKPLFVVDKLIAERWYFKCVLKYIDHLTVDSRHPMAVKILVREVAKGRTIVVFPEGRISLTGSFMKFYEGAAFVALKANVPLIPVYLTGAEQSVFSRVTHLVASKFFPKITIKMLKPQSISTPEGLNAKERRIYLARKTREIMMQTRMDAFEPKPLFDALLAAKDYYGSHKICSEDIAQTPETYASLIKKSLAVGRLLSRETTIGERVGLLLPNSVGGVAALFGASATGRIPAMLNYSAGREGLDAALVAAEVNTILTSRAFIIKGKLQHLIDAFPNKNWIYAEDLRKKLNIYDKLWVIKAKFNPTKYLPKLHSDDEAVVMFTSGSEGKPKGVVHSHRSLSSNIEQIRAVADFTSLDRFMLTLPMFHVFGLTAGILLPLMTGSYTFYYPSPLHYRVIPELTYDKRATVLFGTSTFLANYAKYANPYDFSSVRYVVAGAEKLSDATKIIWMEKFGIRVLEGYGSTECAPVIAINTPMAYKEFSVGLIVPGMAVKLIPVEGIENGQRLILTGPNLMKGYLRYENPGVLELPAADGHANWYDTGDIVSIDAAGFMSILGRSKRFAKIAGEMVSLESVEKLFHDAFPDSLHVATIRKDDAKGEAIVVFTQEKELDRKVIAGLAKERGVTELAVPRDIRYLNSIPLLGSGKPNYVEIIKLAAEEV